MSGFQTTIPKPDHFTTELISANYGNKRRNLMRNKILYKRSLSSVTLMNIPLHDVNNEQPLTYLVNGLKHEHHVRISGLIVAALLDIQTQHGTFDGHKPTNGYNDICKELLCVALCKLTKTQARRNFYCSS